MINLYIFYLSFDINNLIDENYHFTQIYKGAKSIKNNIKDQRFPEDYKGQIRTNCKEKCPEDCHNTQEWQYFDSADEDKEWFKDNTMRFICEGKQ